MLPSSHQPAAVSVLRNGASTNQAVLPAIAAPHLSGQPQPQVQARADGSLALSGMAQRPSASIQTTPLSGPPTYVPASADLVNADLEQASDSLPLIDTSSILSPADAATQNPGGTSSATTTSSTGASIPSALANADDDPDENLPFLSAVLRGKLERVRALLALPDTDVDQIDFEGAMSPLMAAASEGHVRIVAALLAAGASVNYESRWGYTALTNAAARGDAATVEVLLAAGAAVNSPTIASRPGSYGVTPLIAACREKHPGVVHILLGHENIDVNRVDRDGRSALFFAALWGEKNIVAQLIKAGAVVNNAEYRLGRTALTWAVTGGHLGVVEELGAQPDIELDKMDFEGRTALMVAARSNLKDVAASLIKRGVSLMLANPQNGKNALLYAVEAGAVDVVRLLLGQPGIDIDKVTEDGDAALHVAVREDEAAVVEVLLQHGTQLIDSISVPLAQTAPSIAIADLMAGHKGRVVDWPAPDQFVAYFSQLAAIMSHSDKTPDVLRCLHDKGVSMAVAWQLAGLLASARGPWSSRSGAATSATPRQRLMFFVCALSRLHRPVADKKLVDDYIASGISAAAVDRLSAKATRELETLASMAASAAAEIGTAMLNKLVPTCLAWTGLGVDVAANALRDSLTEESFCAPLAQVIASAWQEAIVTLADRILVVPAGLTMAQVMQFVQDQKACNAPHQFALALRRQLASRDSLTMLRTMLGGAGDEGLHALFQVQYDQLRQYCEQLLEQKSSHTG